MRSFWIVIALSACGAPRQPQAAHALPSPTESTVVRDEPPASLEDREELVSAPMSPAVRARLELLPAPPVPWSERLNAMSADEMTLMSAYERESTPTDPIVMTCANGTTVRVGGAAARDPDEMRRGAHAVGRDCAMTIGDLVACRLAIREHPCNLLGATLPECLVLWACFENGVEEAEQFVVICERVGCGSDR